MTVVRVPSVDEMTELHHALWALLLEGRSYSGVASYEEDKYLPLFARLADALRTVRPLTERMEGWPQRLRRTLREIIQWFDEVTQAWGWERVCDPEPLRSAYVAERKAWFHETIIRPLLEIAISWQEEAISIDDCPPSVDSLAEQGRVLGYQPTMTMEEARAQYEDARNRSWETPRIGRIFPSLLSLEIRGFPRTPELDTKVSPAFNDLHAAMIGVAPERNRFIERKTDEVPKPPTPSIPLEIKAPAIGTVSESAHEAIAETPSTRNPPTEKAIQCYRLKFVKGDTLTQSAIARQVYGDSSKQSQVSRDIKRVTRWIQDGNVLPDLETSRPKIHSVDPSKLDKGPRADRGRVRDA